MEVALGELWQPAVASLCTGSPPQNHAEFLQWWLLAGLDRLKAWNPSLAEPLQAVRSLSGELPAPRPALAMTEGTEEYAALQIRGNPHNAGPEVPLRTLEALGGTPGNRLDRLFATAFSRAPTFEERRDLLDFIQSNAPRDPGTWEALALAALLAEETAAASGSPPARTHFPARARNVIFLSMDGGPSQLDLFDYKPLLEKYHGSDPREAIGDLAPTQFDDVGKVLRPVRPFYRRGQSGHWVSDFLPHLSHVIDEVAMIKSMTSQFSEHSSANYLLHTGFGLQGRPSMGAWLDYGLGSETRDLPGFVVLNGGLMPKGGIDCFGSGFLPAAHQGSLVLPQDPPIPNIRPGQPHAQRAKLDHIAKLDQQLVERSGPNPQLEASIQNYETAFRMQTAVPGLMDLRGESRATQRLYGFEAPLQSTRTFGLQCLLARRLVERGVRFVELTCPDNHCNGWDQHEKLADGLAVNCATVDQPVAALLRDLRRLGLLDSTLVVWAGEFGRTPFAQGSDGRDHNPFGYTIWMVGGGVRPGISIGQTDDWGYKVVERRLEIHDLHATMLHLLGLDHLRTTFRFSGRDMRLTDVHGRVIPKLLA